MKTQQIKIWKEAEATQRRGMFTALKAYIRNKERSQINNHSSNFKELEKEKQNKL